MKLKRQEIVHFSTGKYMPYIFVSYSHEDQEIVERLIVRLEESGFCVWVDYNQLRGQHFADEIRDGIRECSIFLECLSQSYVEKPYCEKEFLYADECNLNILAVCMDKITKAESPNRFPVGGSAIAYGTGMTADFEKYFDEILQQTLMIELKKFMETESEDITMKYLFVDQRLTTCLAEHCRNAYKNSGTYCLDQIHSELFPGLADHARDRVYKAENKENVSLYEYIKKGYCANHMLLKGNGGMGKTISMLQTCEHLIEDGICAVYVPLNKVRFAQGDTIEKYIKREICRNDENIWNNLQMCARIMTQGNSQVYLFVDGINELPISESTELIHREIIDGLFYSNAWRGTRFVFASRYALPQSEDAFDAVKILEMLPLEEEQISEFLAKHDIEKTENTKVLSLLSNPLMLSLYANAEFYRIRYAKRGHEYGIQLEENPDSPGKIIRNFLQTQLLQMTMIAHKDYIIYYVLLEYALPYLAYEMIRREGLLTLKEVRNILKMACNENKNQRFSWLEDDQLEEIIWNNESVSDFTKSDIKNLYKYAVDKYRFLYKTGESEDGEEEYVEFLHQDFRDYFAAYHVANEIKAIHNVPKRLSIHDSVLGQGKLPEELVEFCADILHEDEACPWEDEDGWHFPGKTGLQASKNSIAEQSLKLYKGKTGSEVQTIVQNLLDIIRKGRNNCLAFCDFSELDLRACQMNGCHFSEFHRECIYGSNFKNAYIDRTFLLGKGHTDALAAVCAVYDHEVISGDIGGTVIVWNYFTGEVSTIFKHTDRIVNLAFDKRTGKLAIVCDDQIYICDLVSKKIIDQKKNYAGSQYYRYVRFTKSGELEYAFDLYPYTWYQWSGEECEDNLDVDVISGCAKKWTDGTYTQLIYSEMFQKINVIDWESDGRRSIDLSQEIQSKKRVEAIQYRVEGDKVLIALENCVLEYETKTLTLLRKKQFRGVVYDVRYTDDDGLIVAAGKDVHVLDAKWSLRATLKQENIEHICIYKAYGDKYYIVSQDRTIKELDDRLHVTRMRKGPSRGKFTWVKDRKTGVLQMLFTREGQVAVGERFDFENGVSIPGGWCFEMVEAPVNANRSSFVLSDESIVSFDQTDADKKYSYQNHGGIWIYGCSFCGIKGTMSEQDNLLFLEKNGGIIHAE